MTFLNFRTVRLMLAIPALVFALPITSAVAVTQDSSDEQAFATQAVTDGDLDSSRGAFSPVTFNSSQLAASSSNNVVIGGLTGGNAIATGGISNSQGLVNVIQNSGNNVIIQSSTIVSMTINK